MMLLCLDGGTTNTRIRLTDGKTVIDSVKADIGSSSSDNQKLKQSIKEMIAALLSRNKLDETEIAAVLSAGMVTSELGLYELPHLITPVSASDLASGIKTLNFPEITSIPFMFIPGVKNNTPEPTMMRGEETECFGLLTGVPDVDSAAVILPGTHNKVILVEGGKITSIASMMSGELLNAVWHNTILSFSLPDALCKAVNTEPLLEGANQCKNFGFTDAALRVRWMGKCHTRSEEWLGNYLIGAVLYCDIISINANAKGLPLIIGGSDPLKEEMTVLCGHFLTNDIIPVEDGYSTNATAIGQNYLYQIKNN